MLKYLLTILERSTTGDSNNVTQRYLHEKGGHVRRCASVYAFGSRCSVLKAQPKQLGHSDCRRRAPSPSSRAVVIFCQDLAESEFLPPPHPYCEAVVSQCKKLPQGERKAGGRQMQRQRQRSIASYLPLASQESQAQRQIGFCML